MLAIALILVGIILRFMPHVPNATPVAAIALFGGVYLNKRNAILIPLALMMISDLFIGTHDVMFFTWGGFIITAVIGLLIKKHKSVLSVTLSAIASSIIFYIITNFGVWAVGWYPQTLKGLTDSYIMGLPFLRTFVASTLIYTAVFFGTYEFIAKLVKNTKLAGILLTN